MINMAGFWNPKQAMLKRTITQADGFEKAISLCLDLHSAVHESPVSGKGGKTYGDELWEGLDEHAFRTLPGGKRVVTVAWHIWHITRIEDITINILIAGDKQVISADNWLKKMRAGICDTGNALTREEIAGFSRRIDMKAIRDYRMCVGKKTQKIIRKLSFEDMKTKVNARQIQRIIDEGGVTEGAEWLLDFWGRKNMAGILLMPITRHQAVHLNKALAIKEAFNKKKQ